MPFSLTVNVPIFLNDIAHCFEEVVITQCHHILPCRLEHFLRIHAGWTVDGTIHAGRAAKESLSYSLGHGELSLHDLFQRSEERRVGKECRSRWSPYH